MNRYSDEYTRACNEQVDDDSDNDALNVEFMVLKDVIYKLFDRNIFDNKKKTFEILRRKKRKKKNA